MAYAATTRITHSENIRTAKNLDVDGAANVGTLKVAGVSVGAGLGSQVEFTQTYATADTTVPAATVAAVATTGATTSTPYGYAGATQADAIPVAINALTADVLALRKVVNKLIDVLQANGLAL